MSPKRLVRNSYRNLYNRKVTKLKKARSLPFLIATFCVLAAFGFSISVESRSPRFRKTEPSAPQIGVEQTKSARTDSNTSTPKLSYTTSPMAILMAPVVTATKTDALLTDVDNDNQADPGDTLRYTVVIGAAGMDAEGVTFTDTLDPNTNFVPGSIMTTPLARNESYSASGNIRITVGAPGVLANDSDADGVGPALNVTAGTFLSSQGGDVNLSSDGSFTYNPPAGFEGVDTFNYTLNDGEGPSDTGTVSITVSGMIWFIDNNASCPCDGRLTNPFDTIAAFDALNDSVGNHPAANDNIFVYESATDYVGPLTLENGQKFIGQDATDTLSNISGVNPPAGSDPLPVTNSANGTIVNMTSATAAINVAQNNTLRGFTGGNAEPDINGSGFGTLNVSDVTLNGNGQALSLTNGTLNGTFGSISSSTSATTGISLTSVAGSLTTGSTTITDSTGIGISVNTSSATLNFANTSVSGSAGTGVSLTTNTGTITFADLDVSPDANQKGLLATDNTNTITATSGTISNSGATAVEISRAVGTTPLNITLTSVTSSGGASDGISIQHTTGSFSVVGDGTNTSLGGNSTGGTISGKDDGGSDAVGTVGTGVFVNDATNITLRRMTINGSNQNYGIRGTNVTGVTVEYSTVGGTNGDNGVLDEGSIIFDGLTGTNTFTSLAVAGSIEDNFRVRNSSGTANDIIITGSTFTNAPNDNIIFSPSGTANLTAHVTNNTFTGAGGDHLQTQTSNTATLNIVFTGNLFSNGFPGSLLGGVTISGGNAGSTETVNFDISNNGTVGSPLVGSVQGGTININQGAGDGNWQGQVSNNIIGVAGSAGSGSMQSSCIRVENHSPSGDLIASVLNNTCREWGLGAGINFQVGDTGNVNASINLTVTGNNVTNPGAGTQHGVQGNFGAVATGTNAVCFDFKTNNVNLAGGGAPPNTGADLRLRQRNGSTVRLPGYVGASNDLIAVSNFEIAQNTLADSVKVSPQVQAPGGGFVGGAACTSPIVPLSSTMSSATNNEESLRVGGEAGRPKAPQSEKDDILFAVRGENPDQSTSNVGQLTPGEASAMLQAAIARWADAGISAQNLAKLQSLSVEVADLPAGQLATANSSKITLDETAAGYGWFFDSTPSDDNEFEVPVREKEQQTTETSAADGRIDLLTALMRELGTQLASGKSSPKGQRTWLMQNSLGTGTRRAPAFTRSKAQSAPSTNLKQVPVTAKAEKRDRRYQQVASLNAQRNSRVMRHHSMLVAAPTSFADVMLNIGVLPAGKSITITFDATIDDPFPGPGAQVCNQGTVSGTNFSSVLTDDPAAGGAADPTCTPIALPEADLSITKTDGATDEVPGTSITYTITVTNNGPSDANGVSVSDTFPAILQGVTFTSVPAGGASGNTAGSGNINDTVNMPSGSSITYTVNATIASSATGSLSNTATVTAPSGVTDPTPGNNSATDTDTLTPSADVAVDKSGPATVIAGDNITYTISVTNNGPSDAVNLSFSDAVPANTTFVSVTTPGGWTRTDAVPPGGTGTITFTAASLAAGATSNFTLVVNVNAGTLNATIITNTVNVSSSTADAVPGNNTDSVLTTVQNNADLSISKTVMPTGPNAAGSSVTYTVQVTNNGPSPANSVTFSDGVPAGVTVTSQTNPGGWSCNSVVGGNGTITCTKSGMANGETATLTVVATVNCNVANGATINNTATVGAASPADNNAGNNTSMASFTVSNPAPVVTATVTTPQLPQNNHDLVNVGLSASATDGPCGTPTITVQVFGDEDDETPTNGDLFSPDAKDIASATLRLRQERVNAGNGRVYLIVVKATDAAGQTSFATVTVVVPKSNSGANVAAVQAEAAAAKAYADANNGAPPPGYFVIGDGPIIGDKQ